MLGTPTSSSSPATMSAPVPGFLLPRGYLLPYIQLARPIKRPQVARHTLPICRNASASTSKPRVLEKPTKFNPPSHGKRLKQQIPRQYGPQLTGQQKTEQETKKYPNMMPPPGTFMYWFLTSRGIHTFFSLVIRYPRHVICYEQTETSALMHNTNIILPGHPRPPCLHRRLRKLASRHRLPRTTPCSWGLPLSAPDGVRASDRSI